MTIGTATWASRNVSLNGRPFRPADYVQFLEPMEWIDQKRGRTFILRYPPQVGKTLTMQLIALRCIDIEPRRAGWYAKTGTDAKAFAHEKLVPLIKDTPAVVRKYPTSVDDRGSDVLHRFVDAPFSLLSADVQAHRNSKSFQDVFLDEAWQYESGAVAEIKHRTDSYPYTYRVIIGETAPEEGAETVHLFDSSCQRLWHFACPLCGEKATCEHGGDEVVWGLRWDKTDETYTKEGFWKPVEAAKTTRWVCPKCDGSVKYSPSTLATMNDTARGAGYVGMNLNADDRVIGWRATAMVWRNWGEIVQDYLHAVNVFKRGDEKLLREHKMKSRMEVWVKHYQPADTDKKPYGDYNLRDAWEQEGKFDGGSPMRIMTVDVQIAHYWVVVRSFDQNALYSRLYDFQLCFSPEEVDKLRQSCGVDNRFVFVDSGFDQKANKTERYGNTLRMCARFGWDAMNGISTAEFVHNVGKSRVMRPFSTPQVVDAWTGTQFGGQWPMVTYYQYSTDRARSMLRDIREQRDPQGNPYWTIARDTPENYLTQAWARKFVRSEVDDKWIWKEYAKDDHAQDCEGMQMMATQILGLAPELEVCETSTGNGV